MATITYGTHARPAPQWAHEFACAALEACGIEHALCTSTYRTAEDQARVMVEQYVTPQAAAKLYNGPKGRAVLMAWANNLSNPVPAMRDEMLAQDFVSAHMNPNLATFDLAPSSMPAEKVPALVAHLKGLVLMHRVKECFGPGESDAAVHFAVAPPVPGRVW